MYMVVLLSLHKGQLSNKKPVWHLVVQKNAFSPNLHKEMVAYLFIYILT